MTQSHSSGSRDNYEALRTTERTRSVSLSGAGRNSDIKSASGASVKEIKYYSGGNKGHIATVQYCHYCNKYGHSVNSCRKKSNNSDSSKSISTDEGECESGHSFLFKLNTTQLGRTLGVSLVYCGTTSHIVTDKSLVTNLDQNQARRTLH